jgi:mRNA interferase MazF
MDLVKQYDVYLVILDPTIGSEIKKTRPCVIVSPDEMNQYLDTIIIAPLTSKIHGYPTRIPVTVKNKKGEIVLDQIRSIDKRRLLHRIDHLTDRVIRQIKNIIQEMLVA